MSYCFLKKCWFFNSRKKLNCIWCIYKNLIEPLREIVVAYLLATQDSLFQFFFEFAQNRANFLNSNYKIELDCYTSFVLREWIFDKEVYWTYKIDHLLCMPFSFNEQYYTNLTDLFKNLQINLKESENWPALFTSKKRKQFERLLFIYFLQSPYFT